MEDLIPVMLFCTVIIGATIANALIEHRNYKPSIVRDADTGCLYLGTRAGGYTLMVNADGSFQCEEVQQ